MRVLDRDNQVTLSRERRDPSRERLVEATAKGVRLERGYLVVGD